MIDLHQLFLIFMFILIISYILVISISMFKHRKEIKFWTIMTRNGNRISKIAVTFWFLIPIVVYQSIMCTQISPGLIELLYAVFAAELGVNGIDNYFNNPKMRNDNEYS